MHAFARPWLLSALLTGLIHGQPLKDLRFAALNWKDGGLAENLVSAEGVLFAQTYQGGMFRSLDTGKSWRPFPLPNYQAEFFSRDYLHFDPATRRLYGLSYDYTYIAQPRSDGWTRLFEGAPQTYSFEGSLLVYAYGDHLLKVSGDGGATWKIIDAARFGSWGPLLAGGGCIYIAQSEAPVSVSCDGGNTWRTTARDTLSIAPRWMVYLRGAVLAVTERGIVRSADSGRTWSHWRGNLASDSGSYEMRALDTSLFLSRADKGEVLRSRDGGRMWESLPLPDSGTMWARGFPALAEAGGVLFYDSRRGLMSSANGGRTWEAMNPRTLRGAIQSLAPRGRTFLALTERGLFASPDTGITWDQTLAADTGDAWTALAASGRAFAVGGSGGKVRVSADAGAHWSRPFPLPVSEPVMGLGESGGSILAASSQGLWRFSAADSAWKAVALPAQETLQAIAIQPASCLIATASHLWKGNPDGSFADLGDGIPTRKIMGVWFIGDRPFAYTSDGNLRVRDPGDSAWRILASFDRHVLSLVGSGDRMAASTYMGVYGSEDGGLTWNRLSLPDETMKTLAYDEGFVYAGDQGGGVWKLPLGAGTTSLDPGGKRKSGLLRSRPLGTWLDRNRRLDGRSIAR